MFDSHIYWLNHECLCMLFLCCTTWWGCCFLLNLCLSQSPFCFCNDTVNYSRMCGLTIDLSSLHIALNLGTKNLIRSSKTKFNSRVILIYSNTRVKILKWVICSSITHMIRLVPIFLLMLLFSSLFLIMHFSNMLLMPLLSCKVFINAFLKSK